jgi:hypothetical protein
MDVVEKIINGDYKNKLPYVSYMKDKEINLAYNMEDQRLFQLFKKDIEEEFNTTSNPKKDLLFSKAWSMGHASGYNSVYGYYEDLVDLIK